MRSLKLTIAYDGADFAGWQWQAGQRTVQGEFEAALEKLVGVPTRVTASGRTDAGVHAQGQVVGFETRAAYPPSVFPRALNATLPHDIAVLRAEEAPPKFDAIRAARRKRYRYVLHDARHHDVFRLRYAWHIRQPLDLAAMQQAAGLLVGRHDFRSFQTKGSPRRTTVRTIFDATVSRPLADAPHVIHFEVEANGFLYNMMRIMAGTLVDVGRGTMPADAMGPLLAACDRNLAGMTAPAQGLILLRVDYEDRVEPPPLDDEDEPA